MGAYRVISSDSHIIEPAGPVDGAGLGSVHY